MATWAGIMQFELWYSLCMLRGAENISHHTPNTTQTPVKETTAPPPVRPAAVKRRRSWGGRVFRLNLRNFRLRDGLSVRRFSLAEAALILMLAFLISRVLGVVRQGLFNALFDPSSPEVIAYIAAARLPEVLFNLVAGGALIHAFVPIFLSYEKEKGQDAAWHLTSVVFNSLLVVLVGIILVGELMVPLFTQYVLVPGLPPSDQAITTELTRIMLLQPLFLGLGTVVSAVLNSKRQFLLPALSMALYNVGIIGGLLLVFVFPEIGIYGPTYGTVIAVLLQMLIQVPALIKQKMRYSFVWDWRHPGLRQVVILLVPNALAVGVYSLGNIFDTSVTSFMPDRVSLSALHNADMLQNLPLALIAQAVGQSLLPHLTMQAETGRYFRMRQTAIKVMGVSLLLTIPAMLAMIGLGLPFIRLLFQHGEFGDHATQLTYLALIGFAFALPGTAAGNLIVSGFFALKDTLTPLLTTIYALVVRCGSLLLFFMILPEPWIILSVPLAQMVSATTEALLLYVILSLRLRKHVKNDMAIERLQRRRRFVLATQEQAQDLAVKAQDTV